ncbi:MAG: helix-turn-helix domain-containing protein, partial [Oscillospiraceae bacterium]|nr:helix-turn-helix domain-containing protein [Oscillospiraceae bacterium]
MTAAESLLELRKKNNLSQEEFAEKLMITRQAVSRWETGETVPNTDTLKIISKIFGVSINALLGQPRNTICQVCGMPLDDEGNLSIESDGVV